jgi:peptidoglycan/xylan/chitin deacetylase (PgdA/CDA1 family)
MNGKHVKQVVRKLLFIHKVRYLLSVIVAIFSWHAGLSTVYALDNQIGKEAWKAERISDNSGEFKVNPADMLLFPEISGPETVTGQSLLKEISWEKFKEGSASRLAILLTDKASDWLPLVHGLKSIGVPVVITTDYKIALRHKAVLIYPAVSGVMQTEEFLAGLRSFTENGGTLIGTNVLVSSLKYIFGAYNAIPLHTSATVQLTGNSPLLAFYTDEREKTLSIGNKQAGPPYLGVYGYKNVKNQPLAIFEDGSAAITQNRYGKGRAYSFGIDIGHLLKQAYSGRSEDMARSYINDFEPTIDVLLHLIKDMYMEENPDAVTLGTVPFNKELTVMFTHDVDFGESEKNAAVYAEFENSKQAPGTYFLQTKYIKDFNDNAFFDAEHIPMLKRLAALGMELGSHSVAHAYAFSVFPIGSGEESYPSYQPFVYERYAAHNGTVLGELRVSKYLIEKVLGAPPVVSFRPGHLSYPKGLPQALEATGYLYSSNFPANCVLSHLPFKLTYQYESKGETNVFEFPLTLEDELGVKMGDRVQQAVDLAQKISKYGGIYVVLIHPNILDHKLQFEKDFYIQVKDFAWFSTIGMFGNWWAARDQVTIDVTEAANDKLVILNVPQSMEGLTINVPQRWLLQPGEYSASCQQNGNSVIIHKAVGTIQLKFTPK